MTSALNSLLAGTAGLGDCVGRAPQPEAAPPERDGPAMLGLYISVPFCRAKCTFCNFASGVYPVSAMPAYVDALIRQVRSAPAWAAAHGLVLPRRVDTVYLGGGTPSLLPPELIGRLFAALREVFVVAPDAEITLEAAPLQLEPETLEAAQCAGVNRVSFGVQSFVEDEARATARMHTGEQALAELRRVRTAGIAHLSADLIAGLPGQTRASWEFSLATLVGAPLDHASVYMFELDEDSRLGAEALRGGLRFGAGLLPTDDAVADWYNLACEQLGEAGLKQYEISNFARSGGRSRHNERYWLRRPYLGLGVDAHSMLECDQSNQYDQLPGRPPGQVTGARFAVGDGLQTFLDGETWANPERLSARDALEECWFLGLRRGAGVSLHELEQQFGAAALRPYRPIVCDLMTDGLLVSGCISDLVANPVADPVVDPVVDIDDCVAGLRAGLEAGLEAGAGPGFGPGLGRELGHGLGQGDRVCLSARGRLLSNEVFANLILSDPGLSNQVR
jgi:oxygen-independent coproporphyrinogen-3 oxidase